MSWKQYGGIKNLETHKNVTTNTVIADEIILKNSYIGGFTIHGILDVTGKAIIQGNLEVDGTISSTDVSFNTMSVHAKSDFYGNALFYRDISLNNNMYIGNTLSVTKDVNIKNNLKVEKILYLNTDQFIYGDISGIGINTLKPNAGLDISTNNIYGLKVLSTQPTNHNIMSSNINKKGITFTTSDIDDDVGGGTNTHIDFYVNNDIDFTKEGDAYIKYKNRGDLEINALNNVIVLSDMVVSNRPDEKHDHVFNESLVIYDVCTNDIYKYEYYKNKGCRSGNALTLVTNDSSSNTFFRMVTPEKKGIAIGGGAYPNDLSRSMGTVGLTDVSGKYIQNQIIVSGSNPVRYNSTLGINNYKPFVDSFVVDINGPVHIDNGDITLVKNTDFQINYIAVSPQQNFLICVGSSIDIFGSHLDVYGNSTYRQQIVISYDYGKTWNIKDLSSNVFGEANIKTNYTLNNVFIYDNSFAFIVGNNNTLLYTNNGGTKWGSTTFKSSENASVPITDIYNFKKIMVTSDSTYIYVYISGTNSTGNSVFYKGSKPISNIQGGDNISLVFDPTKIFTSTDYNINSFDIGPNGIVYFATTSGIKRFNSQTNVIDDSGSPTSNYNEIKWSNNNFIAVGTNMISLYDGTLLTFTNNDGFTDNSFNSLYTFDDKRSFTISNNNKIWLTKDGGYNWNEISNFDINQSGKQNLITDPSNMLVNLIMSDDNTLLFTNTISTYSTTNYGKSSIINCFFPNLCNRSNNNVLDISGNMRISGDISIGDNGKIMSTNDTFYLLDENVKYLNIGNDAIELNLGNTFSGNTNIEHNLNVGMDTFMNGSLYISGIETIGNVTQSTSVSTGSLIVNGGVGIGKNTNIGGNLKITKNSQFQGLSTFNSDVSMNGNLFINGNTDSNDPYTGTIVVAGGVGIQGNTNIGGNTNITGNFSVVSNTSLNTSQIQSQNSSTSINSGALTVKGGVGIIENVNIGGKIDVGSTMTVRQDASFQKNVEVSSVINAYNIKKQNNELDYYFINRTTNQDVSGDKIFYGNISLLNKSESSNSYVGALTVAGGVGIQGNLNIGGNVNITGNVSTGKNITTYGNIFVNNNNESFNKNSGSVIINGGIGVSGNINIGGNLSIERNTSIYGNTSMSQDLSVSGFIHGNMISSSIQPSTTQFNFVNDGTVSNLKIGNHPNTTINMGSTSTTINIGKTPFGNSSQSTITIGTKEGESLPGGGTIYIGSLSDTVYIQGKTTYVGTAKFNIDGTSEDVRHLISYTNTVIIPNTDNPGSGYATLPLYAGNTFAGNIATSAGAGLWFSDLSVNDLGRFVVSNDLNGYVFQAPTYRTREAYDSDGLNTNFSLQKKVKFNVNGLTTQNGKSCIVSVSPSVIGDQTDFTVSSSNIDLSNVFLKDVDSVSYPNTQNIITNVQINGNLVTNGNSVVNGNSIVNGNTYFEGNIYSKAFSYLKQVGINKTTVVQNTSLDVNGNVIVSRLGIGTSSVNSQANSLEVQGNIYQTSGGFIWQF